MPNSRNYTSIATIGSLIFIAICLSLIILLNKLTANNNLIIAEHQQQSTQEELISLQTEPVVSQQTESVTDESIETPVTLAETLSTYSPKDKAMEETIAELTQTEFDGNLIQAQDEILAAIHANDLDVEELGYLFLPDYPAENTAAATGNQIDVPLYLQKDANWRTEKYGSNTTQQLGENGCAILSLAMVHAAFENREVNPKEILEWSEEKYWVDNAGTSWQIFHDFAVEHNYDFYNYGNDFYSAMEAVNNGELIVASVVPGFFTEVGHIIVIRGYENGQVYVNDPNDDAQKMYSIQGIDEEVLLAEGINYWSFSK